MTPLHLQLSPPNRFTCRTHEEAGLCHEYDGVPAHVSHRFQLQTDMILQEAFESQTRDGSPVSRQGGPPKPTAAGGKRESQSGASKSNSAADTAGFEDQQEETERPKAAGMEWSGS